eukprot:TRINITY_DN100921_c0_g1_i1.p1 TRINITY_DN100921_c0_g1~~TRINITY_DN100921_c0_g1_i1.p1  ORF type:complete len:377 (-),score=72.13 TRINITY_DN100921_c0_g1_i1:250-1380(-)
MATPVELAAEDKRVQISLSSILGGGKTNGSAPSNSNSKKAYRPHHSQSVPRTEDLRHAQHNAADIPKTTMMLRNIPNKYTQAKLLNEIDQCGFEGSYNFFYLPMDVHNRSNVGYAFINFKTEPEASNFKAVFSQHCFQRFHGRKVALVCSAHVQGLEQNIRHFENRAVTHAKNDQYRPVVIHQGSRISFEDAVALFQTKPEAETPSTLSPLLTPQKTPPTPAVPHLAMPAVPSLATGEMGHDHRVGLEAVIMRMLNSSVTTTGLPSRDVLPPPPGLEREVYNAPQVGQMSSYQPGATLLSGSRMMAGVPPLSGGFNMGAFDCGAQTKQPAYIKFPCQEPFADDNENCATPRTNVLALGMALDVPCDGVSSPFFDSL